MRIADKMAFEQVNTNLRKNRTEMADLQHQAATQKRVNKPSDDPLAAARILSTRKDYSWNQQFVKNLNFAKSLLNFSDDSLGDLSELLMRAKELALSQANDASANHASRQVVASEIHQLFLAGVNIGNRKLADRYLFGGYQTITAPFDSNGNYYGDEGEMRLEIGTNSNVTMNIPGSQVFLGRGLSSDGATTINTAEYPASAEELRAMREKSETREKEVSGQVPGQVFEAPLRGPASVVANSPRVTTRAVENQGGINVFSVLKDLEIGLRTNDKSAVQASLTQVDQALDQVILARSQVGARVMVLNSTLETLEKAKLDNKSSMSQLEDADAFAVISDINKVENSLNATLATSGKMIQTSLLDFLK
jgi:flagellar hook-associated protein 3 FlgL